MIKLSPSLLAADLTCLREEIAKCEDAGASFIHIDVMDGIFVPNISFGFPVIEAASRCTSLPLDVHLMLTTPRYYLGRIAGAGASIVTTHIEAFSREDEVRAAIDDITAAGATASLCVKPGTPVESVFPYLDSLGMVLVMTVEPGFGGQPLNISTLAKIRALRLEADRRGLSLDIEVDGGINERTAPLVKEAGANVLVAGSAFFLSPDRKRTAAELLK